MPLLGVGVNVCNGMNLYTDMSNNLSFIFFSAATYRVVAATSAHVLMLIESIS